MAQPFIQTSFAAGEVAPQLWGRTDLAKYKSGCAVLRNFFVDYRGGVSTRAGTSFVGPCTAPGVVPYLLPFIFSSSITSQNYVLEFSDSLIRFILDGAYVTETGLEITAATNAYPCTIDVPGNSYAPGDQIYVSGVAGMDRPNGVSGLNGRTFSVASVSGSTITLFDTVQGLYIDSTTWTQIDGDSGLSARIYAIASPYAEEDLRQLKYTQSADVMDLVHPSYAPQQLKRLGPADWTLAPLSIAAVIQPPVGVTFQAVGGPGGDAAVLRYNYAVTSIAQSTGEESLVSQYVGGPNNALNQVTGISNIIAWTAEEGASAYRVYAMLPVLNGTAGNPPFFVGYIGSTTTTSFHDVNIEPDFSQVPPTGQNPFQLGPLSGFDIVNPGFGFISPSVVITDGTGTGATATATANTHGSITAVTLTNPGTDYSSPVVQIIDTDTTPGNGLALTLGSGFTGGSGSYTLTAAGVNITNGGHGYHAPSIIVTIPIAGNVTGFKQGVFAGMPTSGVITSLINEVSMVVGTNDGNPPNQSLIYTIYDGNPTGDYGAAIVTAQVSGANNPGVVSYFDQRKVFGGTNKQPDTFWMSQVGLYNNFNTSYPVQDQDALTGTIVSSEVDEIQSLTPAAGGLIALTSNGAWLISGGTPGAALTPTSLTAGAQAFSGANPLQPLRINYDLLYVQARGSAVRDLTYNFYVSVYTGDDISSLSSHLFYGTSLVQWCYAEEPFKLVWGVRNDGVLLSLTYMKEQQIEGWARHDTAGQYLSVCSIPEGAENVVYVAVNRFFNGQSYPVVERMASRLLGQNPAQNIPSNPEAAWCVDCGAQYTPTTTSANVLYGMPLDMGALGAALVVSSGEGYSPQTYCQVFDSQGGAGQGGEIALEVGSGFVVGANIVSPGEDYDVPVLEIIDPGGGYGAVVSLKTQSLWTFLLDEAIEFNEGDIIRIAGGYGVVTQGSDTGGGGDSGGGGSGIGGSIFGTLDAGASGPPYGITQVFYPAQQSVVFFIDANPEILGDDATSLAGSLTIGLDAGGTNTVGLGYAGAYEDGSGSCTFTIGAYSAPTSGNPTWVDDSSTGTFDASLTGTLQLNSYFGGHVFGSMTVNGAPSGPVIWSNSDFGPADALACIQNVAAIANLGAVGVNMNAQNEGAPPGSTTLIADMWVEPQGLVWNAPGQVVCPPQAAADWTLTTPVSVVGGLDHFTGCEVAIVADGNVLEMQTVEDGCVTVPPATWITAGAPFTAQVQTLPFDEGSGAGTVQGRRKDIPAVTLRMVDARGVLVGPDFEHLVEVKERTVEPYWRATQFTVTSKWQEYPYDKGPLSPVPYDYNDVRVSLAGIWQEQGYVCLQTNYPMPCTLLAEVPEVAIGDNTSFT